MNLDPEDDVEVLFQEEEPPTQKRELLTSLITRISELEAEASQMLTLFQKDGVTPVSKGKAATSLLKMTSILRELEETLGTYRRILSPPPKPPPRFPSKPGT